MLSESFFLSEPYAPENLRCLFPETLAVVHKILGRFFILSEFLGYKGNLGTRAPYNVVPLHCDTAIDSFMLLFDAREVL